MRTMKNLALGATAFAGAHAVEVARWREWFDPGGRYGPWFLNAGAAVALTLGILALTAAVTAAASARTVSDATLQSLTMAGGAATAMAVTLLVIGPGSIFPIVLGMGAGLCAISAAGGGFLGFSVGALLRRHRKDDLRS